MTGVASADLIRYILGSAVLIGCGALVWKLWALKPVEAPRAEDTASGSPTDLLFDARPQNADTGDLFANTFEPYEPGQPSKEEPDTPFEIEPAPVRSEPSATTSGENEHAELDIFSTPPSHDPADHGEVATPTQDAASEHVQPAEVETEQLFGAESFWDVDGLEWGTELTEAETVAAYENAAAPRLGDEATTEDLVDFAEAADGTPAEEADFVDAEEDAADADSAGSGLTEGADDLTCEGEEAEHPDGETEQPTADVDDAWSSAIAGASTTTAKLSRAQKRAARQAEKAALLEARRDEAKRRRDEARAKRAEKKAKKPADGSEVQDALLDAVAHARAAEGGAAEPVTGAISADALDAADVSVNHQPEMAGLDPQMETAQQPDSTEAAAPPAAETEDGEVVDPFRAAALALQASAEPLATDPVALAQEDTPTPARRKWRNKSSRATSSAQGDTSGPAAPAPFSIVPFSDTAWDDAVAEGEIPAVAVPAAPEPPQLDEWAVAALAETWSQPLPVDPESTDPNSIDHHAYGLPEPLPQRRPASFAV